MGAVDTGAPKSYVSWCLQGFFESASLDDVVKSIGEATTDEQRARCLRVVSDLAFASGALSGARAIVRDHELDPEDEEDAASLEVFRELEVMVSEACGRVDEVASLD